MLALVLIAMIYFVWKPSDLQPILAATLRESTMLMMIIGMSLLYSYVMSYLHISQLGGGDDCRGRFLALDTARLYPCLCRGARILPAAGVPSSL